MRGLREYYGLSDTAGIDGTNAAAAEHYRAALLRDIAMWERRLLEEADMMRLARRFEAEGDAENGEALWDSAQHGIENRKHVAEAAARLSGRARSARQGRRRIAYRIIDDLPLVGRERVTYEIGWPHWETAGAGRAAGRGRRWNEPISLGADDRRE
jgi:hypothetical protein